MTRTTFRQVVMFLKREVWNAIVDKLINYHHRERQEIPMIKTLTIPTNKHRSSQFKQQQHKHLGLNVHLELLIF